MANASAAANWANPACMAPGCAYGMRQGRAAFVDGRSRPLGRLHQGGARASAGDDVTGIAPQLCAARRRLIYGPKEGDSR
jgi:hypothetical protein